ncbi:MAG TPA: RNA 2',3'-cyclic phosphodiesterase [Candidatus Limivivens intestinipullorum]|uniref:RNA 2',3'-cyclic phosphodiesterase n=1 Tax=Candidatus Limivivens intestinipullorum TaxID=2840858 RepID=A0A9D1ER40_9FIRM|nr:RNA 2',3'-cyclic phosphodiesterase [Candidatus Limivivens intestinipullorum]
MRLFIAILLPEELTKVLVRFMHTLKEQGVEGNYVPAGNLHMTLAFIGEYSDPTKVKAVMKSVPFPEFRLSLADTGNFGNILWAGVKGNQKLKTYVKELRAALDANGIPCEKDRFIPHITLVRKASGTGRQKQALRGEATVKRASLMKSELRDGKARYKEL